MSEASQISSTTITPAARAIRSRLLWVGVIAAVIWALAGVIGLITADQEAEMKIVLLAISAFCLQIAVPTLVGSAVVSAFGHRSSS